MATTVTERARRLRRLPTHAEAKLWRRIRNRQIAGAKFRRQTSLGHYIVDFCCEEQSLIIELDGGQYAANASDNERTAWLEGQGYRLLRFWNNAVIENIDGEFEQIRQFLDP